MTGMGRALPTGERPRSAGMLLIAVLRPRFFGQRLDVRWDQVFLIRKYEVIGIVPIDLADMLVRFQGRSADACYWIDGTQNLRRSMDSVDRSVHFF